MRLLNIKANRGIDVVLEDLTLDDKKTYELLSRGDTLGVFQLDGGPMRAYFARCLPIHFKISLQLLRSIVQGRWVKMRTITMPIEKMPVNQLSRFIPNSPMRCRKY